ncbi:MAG: MBL fold metallo-hydrolase [Candidatus Sericytochromatia bacterium]|nr:MBL fold metallo-hydrolase [Candidatus Sericytochromatia bacterium]
MSDSNDLIVRVWGARGSTPTPGPKTIKYGGNTSCLEVRCGKDIIILDAGTGIRELGNVLKNELPINVHILFSHLHWDHIQGFPFFKPFYASGCTFNLYAERKSGGTLEELLSAQMKYPYFPVPIPKSLSKLDFHDIYSNQEIIINDIKITAYRANHPDGCLAYRIQYGNKIVVYATDTEHNDELDRNICKASEDADVLIYDSNFTEEEYKIYKGWGHSTWNEGMKISRESGAKKLILWHHDPAHDDKFMDDLEKTVQLSLPNAQAAYEGMKIVI